MPQKQNLVPLRIPRLLREPHGRLDPGLPRKRHQPEDVALLGPVHLLRQGDERGQPPPLRKSLHGDLPQQ